jgi:hypothetical protein
VTADPSAGAVQRTPPAAALAALAVLAVGPRASLSADQPPPSNAELVAALPATVEGVLILRLEALTATSSLFRSDFTGWGEVEGDIPNLCELALTRALAAGGAVFAYGGSDFFLPSRIGAGDADLRAIVVSRQPLTALRERLERGTDLPETVEVEEHDGLRLYRGTQPGAYDLGRRTEAPCYVGFAGDRSLVTARRPQEASGMVERLTGSGAADGALPERWLPIARQLDLEAPLLVLRSVRPPRSYPSAADEAGPEHGDDAGHQDEDEPAGGEPSPPPLSFAAALPDPARPVLLLAVRADRRRRLAERFREQVIAGGLHPDHYRLETRRRRGGLRGRLVLLRSSEAEDEGPDAPFYLDLIALWLFGLRFHL